MKRLIAIILALLLCGVALAEGTGMKYDFSVVTVQSTPNKTPTAFPRKAATMASKEETP